MHNIKFLIVFLFLSLTGQAQKQAPRIGCKDAALLVQSTEQKESLTKQGFEVLNDAMLSMDSREEFPVVVRLQAGTYYQVVFLGNTRSKHMNLDLYDTQKEAILHKEQQPLNQTSNVISFSFTPATSGDYSFLLSQVMKQEVFKARQSVCGSFTIFRLKQTK
jgi:ssRNA-specific RNase YbeY (16S rRNA maturation enzyme)